jgi:hypothetical protein
MRGAPVRPAEFLSALDFLEILQCRVGLKGPPEILNV